MFGYPGGAILPVFDQLYKTPAKFILNRHEQASGHCADGYARATGKPGVCIVTSGPGATNTVTPLATAQMDSIPIIVFSGQVATKVIGNDAFQEADVTGITRPCTKWNYLVKDVRELPRVINEAFLDRHQRPARAGADRPAEGRARRPPVPKRWTTRRARTSSSAASTALTRRPRTKQVEDAAELINQQREARSSTSAAARSSPAAHDSLRKLADKGNIPCTTTLLGLGAFDEHDPKTLHMLGMHGSAYANYAVQECDCLIAVGARFDDRVTGNLATLRPARQDHPHRHRPVSRSARTSTWTCRWSATPASSLELMLPHIEHRDRKEWFAQINAWKKRYPFKYFDDTQEIQAAVRDRGDQPPDQGRGDHHHRRRPAPDVGRPVLPLALSRAR